jgi:hypothetical protein
MSLSCLSISYTIPIQLLYHDMICMSSIMRADVSPQFHENPEVPPEAYQVQVRLLFDKMSFTPLGLSFSFLVGTLCLRRPLSWWEI